MTTTTLVDFFSPSTPLYTPPPPSPIQRLERHAQQSVIIYGEKQAIFTPTLSPIQELFTTLFGTTLETPTWNAFLEVCIWHLSEGRERIVFDVDKLGVAILGTAKQVGFSGNLTEVLGSLTPPREKEGPFFTVDRYGALRKYQIPFYSKSLSRPEELFSGFEKNKMNTFYSTQLSKRRLAPGVPK